MDNVLDDFKEKKKNPIYSKLAFGFSLITLTLLIVLINKIPSTLNAIDGPLFIPVGLLLVTLISCLAGTLFSVMSLVRKEELKYFKGIGVSLNLFLFILVIGAVIYSKIV
jgi:hypothetical protein